MQAIELDAGYMVCMTCRGYVEASHMSPSCECLDEDLLDLEPVKN
jgi:hypothetical protein